MQTPMRKVAWFQCLSCQLTLTWGQWIFSHLLNPDWSIQISRAPAVCKAGDARGTTNFGAKLEVGDTMQCDMVLGTVNLLSWIFHAIFNEKSCLISMPFLSTYTDVRRVNFFLPVESWLVNLSFPRASRMQGCLNSFLQPNLIVYKKRKCK